MSYILRMLKPRDCIRIDDKSLLPVATKSTRVFWVWTPLQRTTVVAWCGKFRVKSEQKRSSSTSRPLQRAILVVSDVCSQHCWTPLIEELIEIRILCKCLADVDNVGDRLRGLAFDRELQRPTTAPSGQRRRMFGLPEPQRPHTSRTVVAQVSVLCIIFQIQYFFWCDWHYVIL